jgi:hypothetical protein
MAFGLSLDDDEEDFEDAMEMAEQASNNESFSRAYGALEEAKSLGINDSTVADLEKRIDQQKSNYNARIERQEKLARERAVRQIASGGGSGFSGSDIKNLCLGITQYKSSCYSIDNSDVKNICLGMTEYPSSCYSIGSKDLKNLCLGASGQYQSQCYAIGDSDLKNVCLGITQYKSSCYSINNRNLKNLCLGKTESKSNCYAIE